MPPAPALDTPASPSIPPNGLQNVGETEPLPLLTTTANSSPSSAGEDLPDMKLSTMQQTCLDALAHMSARLGRGSLCQRRWLSTC